MNQISLAHTGFELPIKRTRSRMGRPPFALETMLRIHLLQQFFGLSADPAMEEALHDVPLYREFARLDAGMSHLPHTVTTTAANAHDVTQAAALLHGQESAVFADSGYRGVDKRQEVQAQHPDVTWHVAMMPSKRRLLDSERLGDQLVEQLEQVKARIRAKVEHPFRVIKRQFGCVKTRYRGLAKNTQQTLVLFALSNLWMVRKRAAMHQA